MDILFLILLLIIAYLYSTVGHGGASGYLAIMVLFGISPACIRPSAFVLNLFVSAIAFYSYYKAGYFRWKILLPFVIASVPLAYIGAGINVSPGLYKKILGVCLVIAVARMFINPKNIHEAINSPSLIICLLSGAIIGFLSGIIGIGGGIILSPLLLLAGWANIKETAAISAAFIFLNSTAGLFALWNTGISLSPQIILWVAVVLTGGIIGSYSGSFRISFANLRYILAVVLIVACVKLFIV